jgi:hypothetical protein
MERHRERERNSSGNRCSTDSVPSPLTKSPPQIQESDPPAERGEIASPVRKNYVGGSQFPKSTHIVCIVAHGTRNLHHGSIDTSAQTFRFAQVEQHVRCALAHLHNEGKNQTRFIHGLILYVAADNTLMPRCRSTAETISYAPRTMHGVVVHTCTWCFPIGWLRGERKRGWCIL